MGSSAKLPTYRRSMENIALAGIHLLVVIVLGRSMYRTLRLSILFAIIVGALVATAIGRTDFSGGRRDRRRTGISFFFGELRYSLADVVSVTIVVLVISPRPPPTSWPSVRI